MKVEPCLVYTGMARGLAAIQGEFERYDGPHAEEARECMRYVLHERAGSSDKLFPSSPFPRDHGRSGDTLTDFCAHPDAQTARLEPAHVAAIRAYTTAAYTVLNAPLRDQASTEPHPFPVTIAFLREAINKLRAVGAQEDTAEDAARTDADGKRVTKLDLWRGLRDTQTTESFMQHGGTELAPMSTTTKLEVAVEYSRSRALRNRCIKIYAWLFAP